MLLLFIYVNSKELWFLYKHIYSNKHFEGPCDLPRDIIDRLELNHNSSITLNKFYSTFYLSHELFWNKNSTDDIMTARSFGFLPRQAMFFLGLDVDNTLRKRTKMKLFSSTCSQIGKFPYLTRRSNSRFDRVKNSKISRTDTQTHTQSDFLGFLSKPKRYLMFIY